jgi:hypothetical protein
MRNLTLTKHFCDISQSFVSATKYENTSKKEYFIYLFIYLYVDKVRCDQLKNKSSRRVTYGNPCYSIGSKANSIYFLNDRWV